MNKKFICLLMFVLAVGLTFTSCSSDDDDSGNAGQIVGTYTGTLNISGLSATPIPLPNQNIDLSKVDDNNVKLSVGSLDLTAAGIGTVSNIVINSVPVTKSGDTYTLTAGTKEDITVSIAIAGIPTPMPADATVTVNSNSTVTSAGAMSLNIQVETTLMGNSITLPITFSGQKK